MDIEEASFVRFLIGTFCQKHRGKSTPFRCAMRQIHVIRRDTNSLALMPGG
jgi:hypothetical protein